MVNIVFKYELKYGPGYVRDQKTSHPNQKKNSHGLNMFSSFAVSNCAFVELGHLIIVATTARVSPLALCNIADLLFDILGNFLNDA